MPGSGKGEVVRVLGEQEDLPVVRMGDVVWDYVKKAGLPLESEVVGPFANSEREKFGNDIWARRCVERVKEVMVTDVIIDGVRTPNEITVFRSEFGTGLVIVCVRTSRDTRLERILSRGREDDSPTEENFNVRDERELSWGLGEVIDMADHIIDNEGELEHLEQDALQLYARIKQ